MQIRVQVRLFARAREIAGHSGTALVLPDGSSVADCFAQLVRESPRLEALRGTLLVARNEAYAAWGDALEEGDEVAFIPPVSGG